MWKSIGDRAKCRQGYRVCWRKVVCGVVLVAVCLMLGETAYAETHGTVELKYLGRGRRGALWDTIALKVELDRNGAWDISRSRITAGQLPFKWDRDDSQLLDDEARTAFNNNPTKPYIYGYCIDLDDGVGPRYRYDTFEVRDLAGMAISGAGRTLSQASAGYLTEHFARHYGLVDTREEAASFAAVVWEIMYEDAGAYGRADGWVRSSDPGFTSAWLGELDGTVFSNTKVYALINNCYQDMSMSTFGFTGDLDAPIPEPLTLVAVSLSAGGLAGYLRKRRRAASGQIAM